MLINNHAGTQYFEPLKTAVSKETNIAKRGEDVKSNRNNYRTLTKYENPAKLLRENGMKLCICNG
jgi:hypothetical protein